MPRLHALYLKPQTLGYYFLDQFNKNNRSIAFNQALWPVRHSLI